MNFLRSSFLSEFKLSQVFTSTTSDFDVRETGVCDVADQVQNGNQFSSSSSSSFSTATVVHDPNQRQSWALGDFVKSLAQKSDEMLQAYHKDLQEFGSGLKEESKMITAVATHAVELLPSSFETGTTIAQESLESVGQAIEDISSSVWRGTAEIIAHGKEVISKGEENPTAPVIRLSDTSLFPAKYSRFEAQVNAMQHDSSTYCDEPEDQQDYTAWKSGFDLEKQGSEIQSLLGSNTFMQEVYTRFVPGDVTEDDFWTRYFYRLHKIHQAEEARAYLVKRAVAMDEEVLRWDTDEETDDNVLNENASTGGQLGILEADTQNTMIDRKFEDSKKVANSMLQNNEEKSTGMDDMALRSDKGSSQVLGDEDDDLSWEAAEDVEDCSSNDGKRSSVASEASWVVPTVPSAQRNFASQDDREEMSWDDDDENAKFS